ncbi:hypothetical protein [Demequina salsinemoris]|uniref:hypothetical protein n=1 Tax=Demequina salsinemoris TaxID=577470 RepID=UPI000B01C02D|nr:hypothetical protein [Demequina salsinemoris]
MSMLTTRWFAFVTVEDRAGASAALAGVFSERGVSFGSISTLDVHGGIGTLSVEFSASERLAQVLVRTLERLAVVRSVSLVHVEDPRVRAVAVICCPPPEIALPGVSAWTEDVDGEPTTVLRGSLPAIEAAVAELRAAGSPPAAVTVLPPRG